MTGTPFDAGINQIFQQQQAQQKKARQPFIVVLRSQLGNYAGCTVNLAPALVNFPDFPPWPPPPRVLTNAPPAAAPQAPRPSVEVPPLIIIGTKPGTNLPPPTPRPSMLTSNQPPPRAAVPPPATMQPTNQAAVQGVEPTAPAAVVPTNAIAASAEDSGLSTPRKLAFGAALLVLAGVLTLLLINRARRADHGSLITRSMNPGGKPSARP